MAITLQGWVYNDDGTVAPSLAVTCYDQTPTVIGTTTTDTFGKWIFTGLSTGVTYDVKVNNNNGIVRWIKGGEKHQIADLNLTGSMTATGTWDFTGATLKLASPTQIGANAGELIRNPVNSATSVSLESADQYLMLSSKSGSHLAGNMYWDGTNWNLFNTGLAGAIWIANNGGITYNTATAGANPRTPSTKLTINTSGDLIARYLQTNDGSNGIVSSGVGSLYLRGVGASYNAIFDTGSAGVLISSGPLTSVTINNSGTISTGAINSSDWFRLNTASTGLYNTATGTGIQLTGGQLLYPSGDQIVGINTAQTLANKSLTDPKVPSGWWVQANGSYTLPTVSGNAGLIRLIKAWGGNVTIGLTNGTFIIGTTQLGSYVLQNGDSVSMFCDGANWWVF
jgi:hypothetical protein